jgi:hypothetical protein
MAINKNTLAQSRGQETLNVLLNKLNKKQTNET